MRRTLVTAGSFVLLLGAATTSAAAHEGSGDDHGRSDDRTVILGGLDHPGQLSWDDDTLFVTEAGSGGNCSVPTTPPTGTTSAPATSDDGTADQGPGDTPATPTTGTTTPTNGATGTATAATEVCSGTTGSVTAVERTDRGRGQAAPGAGDLQSTLLSDGSVLGPTDAAAIGKGGVLLVALGDRTPAAGSSGADPGADLLVVSPGKKAVPVQLGEQPATSDDGTADQGPGDTPATPTTVTTTPPTGTATPPTGTTSAPATSDDGTADQGPGDTPATPTTATTTPPTGATSAPATSDDGTADQGPGDTPATPTTVTTTPTTGTTTPTTGTTTPTTGTTTPPTGTTSAPATSDDGTADQGPGDTPATHTTTPTVVPNAVMVVDPTPHGREGDTYALVTDAGARTVWKLTPDSSAGGNGSPRFTVTVFTRYDDKAVGAGDFVPTTLTRDDRGTVYVGDGGSTAAAAASVIAYRDRGAEPAKQIDRWDGLTAVNGLAASRNGNYLYVSQLLDASGPSGGAGSIVRVDTRRDMYTSVDFPAPAGVAVGRDNQVFVASHSTSPVTPDDPATRNVDESTGGGQVLRIAFKGSAPEQPLPAAATPRTGATVPAATGTSTPPTGTGDDGTPDQGQGDAAGTTP
jgi:hypothetical protein